MTEFQRQAIALLTEILAGGGGGGLPSQGGQNGKFLHTNGFTPDWAALAGGGDMLAANNLSDVTNSGTALDNIGGAKVGVTGKYRFKSDGTVQLYNATTSKYHTLSISGADGAVVLAFSAGES